eukprot:3440105-Ditylum_brightwellii.AAC.1
MEGRDYMGRCMYTKYAAKDKRIVTVVTAYQACTSSIKTGTTTYHQQVVILKQQHRIEDPRKAFMMDLIKWPKAGHDKGEHVIIGGDDNNTIDTKTKLIKLCTDETLQLVDVLQSKQCDMMNTLLSGQSAIDYFLVSCKLTSSIVYKGYNKFDQFKNTDHCGMYMIMDTGKLFGNGKFNLLQNHLN